MTKSDLLETVLIRRIGGGGYRLTIDPDIPEQAEEINVKDLNSLFQHIKTRFPLSAPTDTTQPETEPMTKDEQSLELGNKVLRDGYLVSRGVRPAAILTFVPTNKDFIAKTMTNLQELLDTMDEWGASECAPIPFNMPWRPKLSSKYHIEPGSQTAIGIAAYSWIPPTLTWLSSKKVPQEHYDHLLGLILGYSPAAIEAFHLAHKDQKE